MALTPEQFLREVDRALRGLDYRIEGGRVEAGDKDHGLTIDLRPLAPRRLSALLSVPRLEVSISFHGYDAQQEKAFVEQFDRAFQRGGG